MADMLRATRNMAGFHDAISVHMIETSQVLSHQQYLKLRNEHPRIEWLQTLDEVPQSPLLLVANEFFDALPIRQYVMTEQGMCERRIRWDATGKKLEFTLGPPGLNLAKSGQKIAAGTVMEQCPEARAIMRQIAQRIKAQGGAALLIDYGYLGDAHRDTLQAVKAHHFHPVLSDPGDADITAHVDFASLLKIASGENISTYGTIAQGKFLRQMGAELRLEMLLRNAPEAQKTRLIAGLERLTSPQAMGELFQVMATCNPYLEEMPGFV
jgi:NADH dehydrogenase [ubiquinone] 1 alpha subcomplex assembly factor 7